MDGKRFLSLIDMLDGGGAGQSGGQFEGGPLSGLLNALGIRPMGSRRDAAVDALPMPMPTPIPAPVTPPVTATPVAPSMDEIVAALKAAPRAPSAPAAYPTLQEIMAMQEAERYRRMMGQVNRPLMYTAPGYGMGR